MKTVELKPLRSNESEYVAIYWAIVELLRAEIYLPLLEELNAKKSTLQNASHEETLVSDILSGKIRFWRGAFTGKFSAATSAALSAMGATWDRKQKAWKIPLSQMTMDVRTSVQRAEYRMIRTMQRIDQKLSAVSPDEIAGKIDLKKIIDTQLWKMEQRLQDGFEAISVKVTVTEYERKKITEEYENNFKRDIKDFTEKEIVRLRVRMQENVMAGNRYETMNKEISRSYDISKARAKFIARQETSLMMSKFKQARYEEAGSRKYRWQAVPGTVEHPTREIHKKLSGKVFSWDSPPITDEKGSRNHPGEDFNCRCVAIPIISFT